METIQIVLESELLHAADRAARRARMNRSALVRRALRDLLKRLELLELEARDRQGYRQRRANRAESTTWERVAVWPEE